MIGFFYMSVRLLYVDYDHYLRFHMSCIQRKKEELNITSDFSDINKGASFMFRFILYC